MTINGASAAQVAGIGVDVSLRLEFDDPDPATVQWLATYREIT